jgi:hypothetical protein
LGVCAENKSLAHSG